LEGRATSGLNGWVDRSGHSLDVVRIVVTAINDDQVLATPGDIQLISVHETQIAGPEEASAKTRYFDVERLCGVLGTVPVADGDAVATDHELAYPAGRQRLEGVRVGDDERQLVDERAAGHQFVPHAGAAHRLSESS